MRKILMLLCLAGVMLFAAQITNEASLLYSVQVSTKPIGTPTSTPPDINKAHIWVKNIIVYNDSDTAQKITIYTSTANPGTYSLQATIPIPSTRGIYPVLNPSLITNAMGNFDVIDMPYMAIRTDAPAGKACWIVVIYGL